jgi:tRNA A-37 threonylcarbamoyl transferase component Bud32
MDYSFFEKQNYLHLKELAEELEIKEYKNKKDLISILILFYDTYEKIDSKYKFPRKKVIHKESESLTTQPSIKDDNKSNQKYTIIKQLGDAGKEGITFLVERKKDKKEFAMKTFKKTKSKKNILHEANCQNMASKTGICPKVIDIDLENNFIVMEKLETHLYEVMKKQKGVLTKSQQQQIYNIFKKLDDANVFHADSNILNYMFKDEKLFIIDFGMSKIIDDKLKKKLQTEHPNKNLMTLGFVLKLKELKCPEASYSYLVSHISKEDKIKYGI